MLRPGPVGSSRRQLQQRLRILWSQGIDPAMPKAYGIAPDQISDRLKLGQLQIRVHHATWTLALDQQRAQNCRVSSCPRWSLIGLSAAAARVCARPSSLADTVAAGRMVQSKAPVRDLSRRGHIEAHRDRLPGAPPRSFPLC